MTWTKIRIALQTQQEKKVVILPQRLVTEIQRQTETETERERERELIANEQVTESR
jgi:hypothetical protein